MPAKPHNRQVPSDPHSSGAVPAPEFIRYKGNMFKLQARPPVRQFRKPNLNPTDLIGKFPGDRQPSGGLASRNLSTRIATQLVAASQAQIPADWQEPSRDALGVSDGVPEVIDVGIVGAAHNRDAGAASVKIAGLDLARNRPNVAKDIDLQDVLLKRNGASGLYH